MAQCAGPLEDAAGDAMSKDKSDIKDTVLRADAFRNAGAIFAVPLGKGNGARVHGLNGLLPPHHPGARDVRVLFDDSSMRLVAALSVGGADGVSGEQVVRAFTRPVADAFASLPNLHTYVCGFDKPDHVPAEKAPTQAKRRANGTTERTAWRWDGVSAVLRPGAAKLPKWADLHAQRGAMRRLVADLCTALERQVQLTRPCTRVILDSGAAACPRIVECAPCGAMLTPYDAPALRNAVGEGDVLSIFYARRALCAGGLRAPFPTALQRVRFVPLSDVARACYSSAQLAAMETPRHVARVRPHYYAPGSVLLRSRDVDFVTLALWMGTRCVLPPDPAPRLNGAAQARAMERAFEGGAVRPRDVLPLHVGVLVGGLNVYVSTGTVFMSPAGTLRKSRGAAGDVECAEYVDIGSMAHAATRLHPHLQPNIALASFVTFCFACGNDYVAKIPWFGRRELFTRYLAFCNTQRRSFARRSGCGPAHPPTFDARALRDFCVHLYAARAGPTLNAWRAVPPGQAAHEDSREFALPNAGADMQYARATVAAAAATRNRRFRVLSEAEMRDYITRIAWCTHYAQAGPCGSQDVRPMSI
jgi:hypothetical protein